MQASQLVGHGVLGKTILHLSYKILVLTLFVTITKLRSGQSCSLSVIRHSIDECFFAQTLAIGEQVLMTFYASVLLVRE